MVRKVNLGVRNLIINIIPILFFYFEIIVLGLPKYSLFLLIINFFLIFISSIFLEKFNNGFTLVKEQLLIDIMSIFTNFFLISGIYIYLHGNGTLISYSNSLIFLLLNFINIFNYLLRMTDNNSLSNIRKKTSVIIILINIICSLVIIYIPIFYKLFNTTTLYLKEIIVLLILSYIFVCWYDIIKIVRRKKYGQKEIKIKED